MSNSPHVSRPLRLVVLSAGVSVPSSTRMLADRLAQATTRALSDGGIEADVSVVEIRDYAHDVVDMSLTHFAPERLDAVFDQIALADGVIAVSPTYNTSFSGLFKSFIDVLRPGVLVGVPVALGATGGTARHSLALDFALRPLFSYLKADIVPTTVFAASEDFGSESTASDSQSLNDRATRLGTELAEYMQRFAGLTAGAIAPTRAPGESGQFSDAPAARGRVSQQDEDSDFVPMASLLNN